MTYGRVVVLCALALFGGGCAGIETSTEVAPSASLPATYGWEQFFKLDWTVGEKNGRPVVDGYVFNDWGFAARDVRLLVEGLDPAGQVVTKTIGYVPLLVAPGTHAYFEVPLRTAAAAYRVSVMTWEWVQTDRRRFP